MNQRLPEELNEELCQIKNIIRTCTTVDMIINYGNQCLQNGNRLCNFLAVLENKKKVENFNRLKPKIEAILQNKIDNGELKTKVKLKVENIFAINQKITEFDTFYLRLKKRSVVLYDSKNCELATSDEFSSEVREFLAHKNYHYWIQKANQYHFGYQTFLQRNIFDLAVFHLHQFVESLFNGTLFTFCFYSPKVHDLQRLFDGVLSIDSKFRKIFPENSKKGKAHFTKLKRSYVASRYDSAFSISEKELRYIESRALKLKNLVERLCLKQLMFYKNGINNNSIASLRSHNFHPGLCEP